MKKVLLAVFLLCGFSLTAQAACPVFRPVRGPVQRAGVRSVDLRMPLR